DNQSQRLIQLASQYCVSGRFAVHAQIMPVCGNQFHHAIEMGLKSALARKLPIADVRKLGHDLGAIFREFKAEYPSFNLSRHDKTVSDLAEFEDLRYPDKIKAGSLGIGVSWSGDAPTIKVSDPQKQHREFALVVDPIDDLMADIFKAASWNPHV